MAGSIVRRFAAAVCTGLIAASTAMADVEWKPAVEVAAGRGERGPWRQNDSRYDYVDDPSVAMAEDGTLAVVWVDQGRKDVFLQRLDADGARRGEPLNVSRSAGTFSWLPRIVAAPGRPERLFVLWQEIVFSGGSHGGEILIARSGDGGASFSEPLNLSRSAAGDGKGRINREVWHNGSLDLAAGADGSVYAAWTEYEGALRFARSPEGETFSVKKLAESRPARGPSLAAGANGTVYLAWTVGDDDAADIRLAKSSDGGASFGAPLIVERSKGYSDAPRIAVDAGGVVHLAYAESTGGPFERYRVRYARSTDGGRTFQPSRPVSDMNGAFPSLAVDDRNSVYVLWELFESHRSRPRGLGFSVSRDGGRSFSAPVRVPGSAGRPGHWNGSFQGLLMKKLAVNGAGSVAVVNSSLRDGERSRVWLIRGQSPNQFSRTQERIRALTPN